MKLHNLFVITILGISIYSCGSNLDKKKNNFSIITANKQTKFKIGETIKATINNKQNIKIDSIVYSLNNFNTTTNNNVFEEKINTHKLGNHLLQAKVYYDGNIETVQKKVTLLNNTPPKIYTYKIIAEYPHDKTAFTQGLEFSKDTLYESTGKNGYSSLRKVNYKTGEVLLKKNLPQEYFAEGITILNSKILQLTWQSNMGFIYNLNTLEKTGDFGYNKSKEGWGLCNNGQNVYKSDGSEKIWILDPNTFAEKDFIQITTNKSVKSNFNELEWVDGKIYANTWPKNGASNKSNLKSSISIINPTNGAIEAIIDLRDLRTKVTQHENLDVLNGIAYKSDTKQLFVTGKNWDKLFEIEIIK